MPKKALIAAAVGAALLLGACQNPPVNNIVDAPLGTPEGVTLNQVRQAVMFAGNQLGWQMREEAPGKIIASHLRSGHMAVVDILYTTTTFSIVYFQSANLFYRAEAGTVHPTYNSWVDKLAQAIQANVAVLAADTGNGSGTGTAPSTGTAPGTIPTAPSELWSSPPGASGAAPGALAPLPDAGSFAPTPESAPPGAGTQL